MEYTILKLTLYSLNTQLQPTCTISLGLSTRNIMEVEYLHACIYWLNIIIYSLYCIFILHWIQVHLGASAAKQLPHELPVILLGSFVLKEWVGQCLFLSSTVIFLAGVNTIVDGILFPASLPLGAEGARGMNLMSWLQTVVSCGTIIWGVLARLLSTTDCSAH